jgi:hypothetical protein
MGGCTDGRRRPTQATAAAPPRTGLTERAKAERKLAWMLCAPAVVVMLLVAGFPILYAFWLSLRRADLRFPTPTSSSGSPTTSTVLTSSTWWQDVGNTLFITSISVSLELVLGMLIAQAMYRAIFARTAIRASVLVPYGAVTGRRGVRLAARVRPGDGLRGLAVQPRPAPADHALGLDVRDHLRGGLEDHAVHSPAACWEVWPCAGGPLQGGEDGRAPARGSGSSRSRCR